MSELAYLWQAIKNTLPWRHPDVDDSIIVNRDGSVRINLDSPAGRERVLRAAESVEGIVKTRPQQGDNSRSAAE